MTTILPCRRCGRVPEFERAGYWTYVSCDTCEVAGMGPFLQAAIRDWNFVNAPIEQAIAAWNEAQKEGE